MTEACGCSLFDPDKTPFTYPPSQPSLRAAVSCAQVSPTQRLALVSYIAHLLTADWGRVAADLQDLGFIPAARFLCVVWGLLEGFGGGREGLRWRACGV